MKSAPLAHALIAAAIIIGYVVLTALGNDGNSLLILLGGQALGAGTQKVAAN